MKREYTVTEEAYIIIKQRGPRNPILGSDIADAMGGTLGGGVGPALRELIATEQHIHRKKVPVKGARPMFAYWYDETSLNPEFGKREKDLTRRTSDHKRNPKANDYNVPPRAMEHKGSADKPEVTITMYVKHGPLTLTLTDAKDLFTQLKKVFS